MDGRVWFLKSSCGPFGPGRRLLWELPALTTQGRALCADGAGYGQGPLMQARLLLPPVAGTFSCTMKFTVRDCDPDTGVPAEEGYDDEYVVSLPRTDSL